MAARCCGKSAGSGFEYAELSHGTRISLLPGIIEAVEAGETKISSLHNFCPLPIGVTHAAPNLYQFSSELPRERELALRHTLKTFDFAQRVKAPAVVLHLGSIEMKDYTEKLLGLPRARGKGHPQIRQTLRPGCRKTGGAQRAVFPRGRGTASSPLPGNPWEEEAGTKPSPPLS